MWAAKRHRSTDPISPSAEDPPCTSAADSRSNRSAPSPATTRPATNDEYLASILLLVGNAMAVSSLWLLDGGVLFKIAKVSPSRALRELLGAEILGLQLLFVIGLGICVWFVHRWVWHRLATGLLLASATVDLLYFLVDLKVYRILGVHLDNATVLSALRSPGLGHELHWTGSEALVAIALVAALVAVEWVILVGFRRVCRRLPAIPPRVSLLAGVFGVMLIAGTFQTARWLRQNLRRSDSDGLAVLPLHCWFFDTCRPYAAATVVQYPRKPDEASPKLLAKRNILYILVESLRSDVATPELMPEVTAFTDSHPCLRSKHHYSSSHATNQGTFSFLFGIHSVYYAGLSRQRGSSWPLRVLRDNGYRLIGGSASPVANWQNGSFMVQQFDVYREFAERNDYRDDAELVDWIEQQIENRPPNAPFFAFVFLHATHHNYVYPPDLERFLPVLEPNYNHFIGDDILAAHRTEVFNRYKNSVLYVDRLFSKLVRDIGADVVVLTGDHGEEFWDQGLLGHAAPRLIKPRTEVPLLLCGEGMKGVTVPVSGHVDILPTVFSMLHPEPEIDIDAKMSGQSLLRAGADHYALISGSSFPEIDQPICVVTPERKLRLKRNRIGAFELHGITDLEDREIADSGVGSEQLEAYRPRLIADLDRFFR